MVGLDVDGRKDLISDVKQIRFIWTGIGSSGVTLVNTAINIMFP